jgi:hypothetical protein
MKTITNIVRLVFSVLLLCSLTYLMVDAVFYWVIPSQRGEWPYWGSQAVFQLLIALGLAKGWIVIYSGRVLPVGTHLPMF